MSENEAGRDAYQEELARLWAEQQARQALEQLRIAITPQNLAQARNRLTEQRYRPEELRALLVSENPQAIAKNWLQDKKSRDQLRAMLRGDARLADQWFMAHGDQSERGTPKGGGDPNFQGSLRALEEIPVPFIRPDVKVHLDDVDTPEERTAFLRKHGTDDPLTRQLLEAALQYGGLSVEPTPFGSLSSPGRGLKWKGGRTGGPLEAAAMQGGRTLTPAQLSAIAQERAGSFRLDDPKALQRMIAKSALAATFATAGGLVGGPLIGGAAAGLGIPGAAAGTAAGGASGAGFAGGIGAVGGGAVGGGLGAGVGGGGDWDDIWKGALTGGLTGGLGYGLPAASSAATGAARGATISGAGNLAGQGVSGRDFDWQALLTALGSGASGGAFSATGGTGHPGGNILANIGLGAGSNLLKGAGANPLAGANAQLDQRDLQRETGMQDAMKKAQAEWMAKYREAQGAQQQAMLEAQREWQGQMESQRGEYAAKLQAFISARESQIAEALRAMGVAEGGIGALLAERKAEQDAERAEAEQARQAMIRSRDFFPSELLEQAPGAGAFPTSSVLAPHSPPAVQFGAEGLPASFASYGAPQTPEFSAEGFLPSGSLPPAQSPAVAPLSRPRRPFPTLLGGLSRSPYLMGG